MFAHDPQQIMLMTIMSSAIGKALGTNMVAQGARLPPAHARIGRAHV